MGGEGKMIHFWGFLLCGFAAVLLLAGALTAAGGMHWIFALFTHFQPHFLIFSLPVTLMALRRRWCRLAAGLAAMMTWHAYAVGLAYNYRLPPARETAALPADMRVVSANLWGQNRDLDRIAGYLLESKADIIGLVEVREHHRPALAMLREIYPHQYTYSDQAGAGLALLSRLPLQYVEKRLVSDLAGVIQQPAPSSALPATNPVLFAEAVWNKTVIQLAVLHLPRPTTARLSASAAQQITDLAAWIGEQDGPLLVMGDFNATPWSPAMSPLWESGLRLASGGIGLGSSWPSHLPRILGIPIDHILATDTFQLLHHEAGPAIGSDHWPIAANLRLSPSPRLDPAMEGP